MQFNSFLFFALLQIISYPMLLPEELLEINEMVFERYAALRWRSEHSFSNNKLMSTCATNLMDPIEEKNLPSSHAHGTIAYILDYKTPRLNKLLEHELEENSESRVESS